MSHKKTGHYCKICGEHKANEKFSGKGHSTHICKSCSNLSASEKSEKTTMNKLYALQDKWINETDKKWLYNRTRDKRPEVRELALEIYNMRFQKAKATKKRPQITAFSFVAYDSDSLPIADSEIEICSFSINRKEKCIDYFERNIDLDTRKFAMEIIPTEVTRVFKNITKNISELDDFKLSDDDELIESEELTWTLIVDFQDGTQSKYGSEYAPDFIYFLCDDLCNLTFDTEDDEPYFIDVIADCDDLLEVADNIEALFTGDKEYDEYVSLSLIQDILTIYFDGEYSDKNKSYYVHQGKNANLKFVQTFLMSRFSEIPYVKLTAKEKLMEVINYIKSNFVPPVGEIISENEVTEILDLLEVNYSLMSKLTKREKMHILLIENTHKLFNSICNTMKKSTYSSDFKYEVYCFHHKQKNDCHPLYVFLHEIGHMVSTQITKDAMKVSEVFLSLAEMKLGKPLEEDAPEFFADMFSVSMLCKFGYKHLSPFGEYTDLMQADFADYFENLLKNEF